MDNRADRVTRHMELLHALAVAAPKLDTIAYFGHGLEQALYSAGIYSDPHRLASTRQIARGQGDFLPVFVQALREACGLAPKIILYACLCGIHGGIANRISDELRDIGADVYGHVEEGHSYRNPNVAHYPGGARVVRHGGLFRAWNAALHDEENDLWMRFPFMDDDEIAAELA